MKCVNPAVREAWARQNRAEQDRVRAALPVTGIAQHLTAVVAAVKAGIFRLHVIMTAARGADVRKPEDGAEMPAVRKKDGVAEVKPGRLERVARGKARTIADRTPGRVLQQAG